MNKSKKYINQNSLVLRRILVASLIVLGFLCVYISADVLKAFTYEAIKASISFECKEADDVSNNSYQICIEPKSQSYPAPDSDTITIDDSGKGEFELTITEPGTYDYLLYQKAGSDKKIDYDDAQYEAHVFVTSDANDKLTYAVTISYANSSEKPTEGAVFKNMSQSEEPTTETTTEDSTEATTEATEEKTTEASSEDSEDQTTEATTEDAGEAGSDDNGAGNNDSGKSDSSESKEDSIKKDPADSADAAGNADTAKADPAKVEEPAKDNGKGNGKGILTGDNALILGSVLIAIISLAGIVLIVRAKMRDRLALIDNDDEENEKDTGRR